MNDTTETKAQIHADINRLRAILGQQPLTAYKAKDLSRGQLVELREQAELDLNDVEDASTDAATEVIEAGGTIDEAEAAAVRAATEKLEEVILDNATGEKLEKVCKRCGEMKPMSEFLKDSKKEDGKFHLCGNRKRGCVAAYYSELKDRKDADALEANRIADNNG